MLSEVFIIKLKRFLNQYIIIFKISIILFLLLLYHLFLLQNQIVQNNKLHFLREYKEIPWTNSDEWIYFDFIDFTN